MKDLAISIRMYLFWTLILGLAYPVFVTGAAQALFAKQANGGILSRGGQDLGAELMGQKFTSERYFWSRPSAVDYNPLSSGGSNSGPIAESLRASMVDLTTKLKQAHPDQTGEPPQDLLFASGSGLDPHISREAALYQIGRVAKARQMDPGVVRGLVDGASADRQFGVLGEFRVNVLVLNLALDHAQGIESAPQPLPSPAAPTAPAAPGEVKTQ